MRRGLGLLAVLVILLTGIGYGHSSTDAAALATPAFTQQWGAGEAITPNFWGPLANARIGQQEPYQQAPGGLRAVQYFDKGRMELTNGTLTNGLLATELITGRLQIGDNSFRPQSPPAIPIAGDANNPAPTYAGLASQGAALLKQTTSTPGGLIRTIINPDGSVTTSNAALPDPALAISAYDDTTQHNIARVFVEYRKKVGLSAIGLAISEPFRANVKVGGTAKDVMVQIFERRALTYTASNPAAFQVEMGNIGQHYYQWRYAVAATPTAMPTTIATTATSSPTAPPKRLNGNTAPIRSGIIPTTGACPIIYPVKGATQGGVAVYDSPGSATYAATKPEICFISPADAEAGGYQAIQR